MPIADGIQSLIDEPTIMPKRSPSGPLPMGSPSLLPPSGVNPDRQIITTNKPYLPRLPEELHDIELKIKELQQFLNTPKSIERLSVGELKLLKKLRSEYTAVQTVLRQLINF